MHVYGGSRLLTVIALLFYQIYPASFCTFNAVYPNFTAQLSYTEHEPVYEECLNQCYTKEECTHVSFYEGTCYIYKEGSTLIPVVPGSQTYELLRQHDEPSCPRSVTVQTITTESTTTTEPLDSACAALHFPKTTLYKVYGSMLSKIDRKVRQCSLEIYKTRPDFCTPLLLYTVNGIGKFGEPMEQGGKVSGYVFTKYCACGATIGARSYKSKDGSDYVVALYESEDRFPFFPMETQKRFTSDKSPIFFVKRYNCS